MTAPVNKKGVATAVQGSIKTEHSKTRQSNLSKPAARSNEKTISAKATAHSTDNDSLESASAAPARKPSTKKRKASPAADEEESEKRLRRHRAHAPRSFVEVYDRALSQRFYVLERKRKGSTECPGETVQLAGSTGNIYSIDIDREPTCNCPHALKGNQCKHVIYVMSQVLNAPYSLVYQLALLSSELKAIFEHAPPISSESVQREAEKGNRKPIEGDCGICFCELNAKKTEEIVWCRAACGQNIHQECFQNWAKMKSARVTCPYCRSAWEGDQHLMKPSAEEGYTNIAHQLGISTERDVSSYSPWSRWGDWRRRRAYW